MDPDIEKILESKETLQGTIEPLKFRQTKSETLQNTVPLFLVFKILEEGPKCSENLLQLQNEPSYLSGLDPSEKLILIVVATIPVHCKNYRCIFLYPVVRILSCDPGAVLTKAKTQSDMSTAWSLRSTQK